MATTAGDIINAAFRKVGIEDPTATQTAQALTSLNDMVSLWGADRLMYCVTSETFDVTAGDQEYTIGSGGDWDTVRPISVRNCYLKGDTYDYPLGHLSARDYSEISSKDFTARPTRFYFLEEYPLAKIIFNASPDEDYTAYFEFVKNFTEFTATSTSVTLPNEYKAALVYNLAISIAEDWDRKISQTIYNMAEKSIAIIDRLHASNYVVPIAKFDGFNAPSYDIRTDAYGGSVTRDVVSKTISSGAITVSTAQVLIALTGEGDTTDTLTAITQTGGGYIGATREITLKGKVGLDYTITISDSTYFDLQGDFAINNASDTITLISLGSGYWLETGRSDNG
jgi:hypothetical protein